MYFSAKLLFTRKSSALLSHVRNLGLLADRFQHHHSAPMPPIGHRLRNPDVHCSPYFADKMVTRSSVSGQVTSSLSLSCLDLSLEVPL